MILSLICMPHLCCSSRKPLMSCTLQAMPPCRWLPLASQLQGRILASSVGHDCVAMLTPIAGPEIWIPYVCTLFAAASPTSAQLERGSPCTCYFVWALGYVSGRAIVVPDCAMDDVGEVFTSRSICT